MMCTKRLTHRHTHTHMLSINDKKNVHGMTHMHQDNVRQTKTQLRSNKTQWHIRIYIVLESNTYTPESTILDSPCQLCTKFVPYFVMMQMPTSWTWKTITGCWTLVFKTPPSTRVFWNAYKSRRQSSTFRQRGTKALQTSAYIVLCHRKMSRNFNQNVSAAKLMENYHPSFAGTGVE